MTHTACKIKTVAVKALSLLLCAVFLFLSCPVQVVTAVGSPSMYINDTVFSDWSTTPMYNVDGVAYIPITMFIDLDAVYYYSNPGVGTFYIQNETTKEYLSFSLKAINDAYNGKGMIKIDIRVFNDTIYLPAIETASQLGLFVEMNSDNTIIRLSDSTAKMPFSKLIELYNPVIEAPGDEKPSIVPEKPSGEEEHVTLPSQGDKPSTDTPSNENPPEPAIVSCNLYLCFADPHTDTLDDLLTALESRSLASTFFLSYDYIKSNPKIVLKLYSRGYSIGLYGKEADNGIDEIYKANDLLRKITKKKTRIVALDSPGNTALLERNGFNVHSFNITSPFNPSSSKIVASAVTSALPGVSTAKILMQSDMYSVSAIYEIGRFINSHDIIHSREIDETIQ